MVGATGLTTSETVNNYLHILFTLDYEIHGNGDGDPLKLMVRPTYRLLDILEQHGAKLTIFADIAEIIKFKEYYDKTGNDKFHVEAIEEQLKYAVVKGHDVQLHIHSSYFNASYSGIRWEQYWQEYDLAKLPYSRISEMIKTGKNYLESLIIPVKKDYKCIAFRAANWSMMPSNNICKALIKHGMLIDSSVYKWGRQYGNVNYNYSNAHSNCLPYPVDNSNINLYNKEGLIIEFPIYSELRGPMAFIKLPRFYRMIRARFHKHTKPESTSRDFHESKMYNRSLSVSAFFKKHAWKLDFSQSSARQMLKATNKAAKVSLESNRSVSLVLIGHSKTILGYNQRNIHRYLKRISSNKNAIFSVFSSVYAETKHEFYKHSE